MPRPKSKTKRKTPARPRKSASKPRIRKPAAKRTTRKSTSRVRMTPVKRGRKSTVKKTTRSTRARPRRDSGYGSSSQYKSNYSTPGYTSSYQTYTTPSYTPTYTTPSYTPTYTTPSYTTPSFTPTYTTPSYTPSTSTPYKRKSHLEYAFEDLVNELKSSKYDSNLKKEISDVYSNFITNIKDPESLANAYDLSFHFKRMIMKDELQVKRTLQILNALTGKKISKDLSLNNDILNYSLTWKESLWRKIADKLSIPIERKIVKTKGNYRSRSPSRKRGEYSQPDASKNITFSSYMVEIGHYGKDTVCLAASNIGYNVLDKTFRHGMESVYWSIMDCPYTMVVIEITAIFKPKEPTHANLLLINKSKSPWEIERFEPHGMVESSAQYAESDELYTMQERIDTSLKEWFTSVLGSAGIPFVYKRPMDVCPHMGPQTRSERVSDLAGFCQTWTKFYWNVRLDNPQMSGEEILHDLFEIDPEELFEMIQDYVHFVKDITIPKEFIELLTKKKLASIGFELNMEEIRKLTWIPDKVKDEISHALYTIIAKMNDITTFTVYENITYSIQNMIQKDDANLKRAMQIIKALTGKKLQENEELRDALFNYRVYWKEEDWAKFVTLFTSVYGPLE